MSNILKQVAIAFVLVAFISCDSPAAQDTNGSQSKESNNIVSSVLTKEKQSALSPDDVIASFKEGNARYMKNNLTARDYPAQIKKSTKGQSPEAIILSCVDSRVPVESIFDKGIGDVFVARVAGNFSNVDNIGSAEYACKVAGSKVVLVMGHEHCGAVKAAVDDVKLGNITSLLSKIRPVVEAIEYEGDRTSKNAKFVDMAVRNNVKNTINEIRKNSSILKEMEDKGEIKIVGAVYDLDNGKVEFLD